MSERHLSDLRLELGRRSWRVIEEGEGNEYDVSATWTIVRPDGSCPLTLEFQGLDDLETLPISKAYGCRVREAPEVGLYFARVGRSWPSELKEFFAALDVKLSSEASSSESKKPGRVAT